jgi:hypothetical protein
MYGSQWRRNVHHGPVIRMRRGGRLIQNIHRFTNKPLSTEEQEQPEQPDAKSADGGPLVRHSAPNHNHPTIRQHTPRIINVTSLVVLKTAFTLTMSESFVKTLVLGLRLSPLVLSDCIRTTPGYNRTP